MHKAFVLGAGLGTRLRPLTDQLPKPLIPFFHRPLIEWAFDHLRGAGIQEFIVNTHHLPHAYDEAFPEGRYKETPVHFEHEPVLLETGGGIANIANLTGDGSFIVYNGDILTDLPLSPLLREHEEKNNLVTLVLRSKGPSLQIGFNQQTGMITQISGKQETGKEGLLQFTGIYTVNPSLQKYLIPGKVESVVHAWRRAMAAGERVGAVVIDEGEWWDLGDRESYINAHASWNGRPGCVAISPSATVDSSTVMHGCNVISASAVVNEGSSLEDCILWPGARVGAGTWLKRCIVRSGVKVSGEYDSKDF